MLMEETGKGRYIKLRQRQVHWGSGGAAVANTGMAAERRDFGFILHEPQGGLTVLLSNTHLFNSCLL